MDYSSTYDSWGEALNTGGGSSLERYLVVTSREDDELYRWLKRVFAQSDRIEIVRDRRFGEWRTFSGAPAAERRRRNRRARPDVDAQVQWRGWAMVRLSDVPDTQT